MNIASLRINQPIKSWDQHEALKCSTATISEAKCNFFAAQKRTCDGLGTCSGFTLNLTDNSLYRLQQPCEAKGVEAGSEKGGIYVI